MAMTCICDIGINNTGVSKKRLSWIKNLGKQGGTYAEEGNVQPLCPY